MSEDLTHHDDVSLYAGADWVINGTLKNATGGPYDLNGADLITWVLLDADGRPSPASDSAVIAVIEPASDGKITISVPDIATTHRACGTPSNLAQQANDRAAQSVLTWP